jgi:oxygen-independent coproporphyrinogen-3 oxidase
VDEASVGVYVHVPFCERICPYCDFAVVASRTLTSESEAAYVNALLAELRRRRQAFQGRALESLYLGGGTPSLLGADSIARIIASVREVFPARGAVEVTLEVNPSTLERGRLPGFREAGVDRVSVGVQSFDNGILKRLGRAHRAEEARRTLTAVRNAGFPTLCLDLIFGAPGQTTADLERDLEQALGFAPEHVSTYELTLEPNTPFGRAGRERLALPAEDAAVAMHGLAEEFLVGAGYERYELSNYARPGREAVHNRRYWERRPVLGLGVGAVSSDPPDAAAPFGRRRANTRELSEYLASAREGRSAEAGPAECLDASTARGEAAFLALREARGLQAVSFSREFGASPRGFWPDAIDALLDRGLLIESPAGDLRLTQTGRMLSDSVFQYFV